MRVNLTGDCTVAQAEEIRAALLEALAGPGSVEIDLSGVTASDLSFCQMLHALKASCAGKGASFTVLAPLPEEQACTAMYCGLPELAGLPPGTSGPQTEASR